MKALSSALFALSLFALPSLAAEPESFQLDVSRAQGSLDCQLSSSADMQLTCNASIKALGKLSLKMTMGEQENMKGFAGYDKIKEAGTDYVLVVAADADKKPRFLVMAHGTSANDAFDGGLSIAQADKLIAINIAPFHLEKSSNSAKLHLSFVAYGPAQSFDPASERDQQRLQGFILDQVRPLIPVLLQK